MTTTATPTPAKTAKPRKSIFGRIMAIARHSRHLFTWSAVILVATWATLTLYGWKPGHTAELVFFGITFIVLMFEIAKTMTTHELGKGAFLLDQITGLLEWTTVVVVFVVQIMQGHFDPSNTTMWAMLAFGLVESIFVMTNRFAIVARQITAVGENPNHHDHDDDHD